MKNNALGILESQHSDDRQKCRQIMNDIQQKRDKKTVKANIMAFWTQELKKHVDAEESLLIPFLVRHRFNDEYINVLKREHNTIRLLAERMPVHDDGEYLYKAFINLVDQHTSFEDEIVFRKMKENIPTQDLHQLDYAMRQF